MRRAESVPLGRILKHLPEKGTWYAPAYQGPAGLFVIREAGFGRDPLMFQVCHLTKNDRQAVDASEPFMTLEGADQFAQRMAAGSPEKARFA